MNPRLKATWISWNALSEFEREGVMILIEGFDRFLSGVDAWIFEVIRSTGATDLFMRLLNSSDDEEFIRRSTDYSELNETAQALFLRQMSNFTAMLEREQISVVEHMTFVKTHANPQTTRVLVCSSTFLGDMKIALTLCTAMLLTIYEGIC